MPLANCGISWAIVGRGYMEHFFSGAHSSKIDEKNRFVLPHDLRYGLVENGILQFSLALGMGGNLSIYRKSDMDKLINQFQKLQYVARYQKFLTIFFSTLFHTECDKVGRITLPPLLKKAAKIDSEIVIAGVLNKIEIWPKEAYEAALESFLSKEDPNLDFSQIAEEAFGEVKEEKNENSIINRLISNE